MVLTLHLEVSVRARAESGMPRVQGFQPHRVYPRFGSAFEVASRLSLGVPTLVAVLGRVMMDTQASSRRILGEGGSPQQIAVCGFPRTGTTYLSHAFEIALGGANPSIKTHDAMAPSTLDLFEITTVMTVRDPVATISSWSLYHGDIPSADLLKGRLATFTAWHRIALRAVDRYDIDVLSFEDFTRDTPGTISQFLDMKNMAQVDASVDFEQASRLIDAETHQETLSVEHRNLPSPARSARARQYDALLRGAELAGPLRRAYAIVQELQSHACVSASQLV